MTLSSKLISTKELAKILGTSIKSITVRVRNKSIISPALRTGREGFFWKMKDLEEVKKSFFDGYKKIRKNAYSEEELLKFDKSMKDFIASHPLGFFHTEVLTEFKKDIKGKEEIARCTELVRRNLKNMCKDKLFNREIIHHLEFYRPIN